MPGPGLAIWHVDELGNNEYQQRTSRHHYECSRVQGDGKCDLENGIDNGDEHDLFQSPLYTSYGRNTNPALR